MYTTRSALIKQWEQTQRGRMILSVISKIWSYISRIYRFFRNHKNMMTIMIPVAAATIGLCLYLIVRTVILYYQFYQDPNKLLYTNTYNTSLVEGFSSRYQTLDAAISGLQSAADILQRYEEYLSALQTPYTYFLQHRLLPSLFIRQDPYTKAIDTGIVGRRFIQENPFTDTALIQYWSDFFRNVGDGTDFIVINDMRLGTMQENELSFTIPITVSFTAPSKRAFLLLIDKLSLTSQESTISLINQFLFHLRAGIKKKIPQDITDPDTYIGQYIYDWVFHNATNTLIDGDIIWYAVQETAQCQLMNRQACLYNFRNIYRNIPQLAYGVGIASDESSIDSLKRFLQEIPPVITIADFSFKKMPARVGSQSSYEGSIVIQMHGRSVKTSDVDQVAYLLGSQCLGSNTFLSPELAADTVDAYLRRVADTQLAQQQSTQLLQLRRIITENQASFDKLSNYNKVIKLFEIQRMLADAGICSR